MASIEKRTTRDGQVRYRARITLKGHPRISETFSTLTAARKWAKQTEAGINAGLFHPGSETHRHTVGDMIRRYEEERLPNLADKHVAARLQWWGQQLGMTTALTAVTPERITAVKDRLLGGSAGISGKPLAPATVRKYLTMLSGAFAAAHKDWLWMKSNPVHGVRKPADSRGHVRFLDDGERDRLFAACRDSADARLYPLVLTALYTGARRNELMRLRWADVDMDRQMATLHETKNGDRRALVFTGPAAEALRQWSQVRRIDTDLVFPSPTGKAVFPERAWKAALAAAGITDFRFHDLRHTFASYLAMTGATLAELAEALGHRSLGQVKRYAHLTEGHTRSVLDRMSSRFGEGSSPLSAVA